MFGVPVLLVIVASCRLVAGGLERPEGSCNLTTALQCSQEQPCPPGLFCTRNCCECGSCPSDFSWCNGTDLLVLSCFCVTYDLVTNVTSAGFCSYQCSKESSHQRSPYYPVPKERRTLNQSCSFLNRTGVLCGRCLPGHYPLAYSFHMACVPCPHARWNWVKYIAAAYLPLTFFCVLILYFRVNILVCSMLYLYMDYCQMSSTPVVARLVSSARDQNLFFKIIMTVNGVWNLDFFRPFYTDLCLGMGILPTLALDYAIAVYPLLLIIVTCFLVDLYDRNYRLITMLWKPFKALSFYLNLNARKSLIHSFVSFLLLSSSKFLSVSSDLLAPTSVYSIERDSHPHTLGLHYAAHIEYFGKEHLPYAVLAIFMLCIFYISPLLLLVLYPFRFFRKFLHLFPFNFQVSLHSFMDVFHCHLKDGTQPGTRDCRWLALGGFIGRLLFFGLNFLVPGTVIVFCLVGVMAMIAVMLATTLDAFKTPYFLRIYIVYCGFCGMLLFSIAGSYFSSLTDTRFYWVFGAILLLTICFPHCCAGFLAASWTLRTSKMAVMWLVGKCRGRRHGYQQLEGEEELCDRLENPDAYRRGNNTLGHTGET